MKFFNEKYSPLTDSVYFLKAGLSDVATEFLQWQKPLEINENRELQKTELTGDLEANLLQLLPISVTEIRRFLFLKTTNEWTAMISNTILGTDGAAPSVVSERLMCELVRATIVPDATMFEYANPLAPTADAKFRYVYAMKEGKWEFHQDGQPLDFEDLIRYKNERMIKNKLDAGLLIKYLMNLGIDYNTKTYYQPDSNIKGILISKEGPLYANDKALTLHAAQNYYRQ